MKAVNVSTVTLYLLNHGVGWRVVTFIRATEAVQATSQYPQKFQSIRYYLQQQRKVNNQEGIHEQVNIERKLNRKRKEGTERQK